MRQTQSGFTLAEVAVALAIGAILAGMAIPALAEAVESARLDGAVLLLVSDARQIHKRSVTTGWDFRLVGYGATATSNRANQYRIIGRLSGTAWPDFTGSSFESDTQVVEDWVNITARYPGVVLDAPASDEQFTVTFNPRGLAQAGTFNGLMLVKEEKLRTLAVSTVGSISIQ